MARTLTVKRKAQLTGAFYSYSIQIDGVTQAKIASGGTVALQIPTRAVTLTILSPVKKPKPTSVYIPDGNQNVVADISVRTTATLQVIMDISLSSAGAARTGAGIGTQAGINELDAYRAGGALRTEIPNNPKNVREALLAVIATWSASYIAIAFERDGDLGKMLQKYGGEMDYALVRYTRTEFIVDAYFRNCPMPNYVFRYTYNEIAERGNQSAPAITLVEEEINLVQRMAFSRLCDKKAELKMKSGRIYI